MKNLKTLTPRNFADLSGPTGNIYEGVALISKRSQQINSKMRNELDAKLAMITVANDNLEEVFENKEQIEISKSYEKKSKPTLTATEELLVDQISPQYADASDAQEM